MGAAAGPKRHLLFRLDGPDPGPPPLVKSVKHTSAGGAWHAAYLSSVRDAVGSCFPSYRFFGGGSGGTRLVTCTTRRGLHMRSRMVGRVSLGGGGGGVVAGVVVWSYCSGLLGFDGRRWALDCNGWYGVVATGSMYIEGVARPRIERRTVKKKLLGGIALLHFSVSRSRSLFLSNTHYVLSSLPRSRKKGCNFETLSCSEKKKRSTGNLDQRIASQPYTSSILSLESHDLYVASTAYPIYPNGFPTHKGVHNTRLLLHHNIITPHFITTFIKANKQTLSRTHADYINHASSTHPHYQNQDGHLTLSFSHNFPHVSLLSSRERPQRR